MVRKKFSVDGQPCVPCYCPTTPTEHPSTKRGTSVGPPVAVNIELCGYLWKHFWSAGSLHRSVL